jgi:GNAT superfamily N-acetyltransferase
LGTGVTSMRWRQVGTVQRIRVRKHGHGLVERDPVFSEVGKRLARVPLEHNSVYTKRLPPPGSISGLASSRANYAGAAFDVILVDGQPAGRLYVAREDDEICIVDIALLPEYCNRGIGTTLLGGRQSEAAAAGRPRLRSSRYGGQAAAHPRRTLQPRDEALPTPRIPFDRRSRGVSVHGVGRGGERDKGEELSFYLLPSPLPEGRASISLKSARPDARQPDPRPSYSKGRFQRSPRNRP